MDQDVYKFLANTTYENHINLYRKLGISTNNYLHSTLNIKSPNCSSMVNIIINCQMEQVNSKIIAIPTDFDQTMFSNLQHNKLTIIYLYSTTDLAEHTSMIYNDINKYYRNFNLNVFPMEIEDYILLQYALTANVTNMYGDPVIPQLTLKTPLNFGDNAAYILPDAVSAFLNKEKYNYHILLHMSGWKTLE